MYGYTVFFFHVQVATVSILRPFFHPVCCYDPLQGTGLIDRLCEEDVKDRDFEVYRDPADRDLDMRKLSRAPVASS
jgi:hypothetical protein